MEKFLNEEKVLTIEKTIFKTSKAISKMLEPYQKMNFDVAWADKIQKETKMFSHISTKYEVINKLVDDMKWISPLCEQLQEIERQKPAYILKMTTMLTRLESVEKQLEYMQNDTLFNSVKSIALYMSSESLLDKMQKFSEMNTKFFEITSEFEKECIDVTNDGTVVYAGVRYSEEEFIHEVEEQIECAIKLNEQGNVTEQSSGNIRLLIQVIKLVLMLFLTIPDISDAMVFWNEQYAQIQSIITQENRMSFTIEERSYVRSEANGNAEVLIVLPYDTCVEIVDDIPRWYKIRYVDEAGNNLVGWTPKRNID